MTSTDLIDTAKNGLYKETLALIQSGFPINARDKDNGTPLYWSSCRGFVQICQLLIKAGCDINAYVTWGSTPLHAAADRGHEDCVLLLVQSGAEVNRQNKRGDTPLHLASYRGHINIVKTLIDWGADCSIKNNMSKMPAEEAESGGHPELARLINARLHNMTRQNSLELRKQSTANVDIQEQNGYTGNILPTNDLSGEIINDAKVKGEDFIRYNQSISGFIRRPQPQENDSDGGIFIKHVQNNYQILAKSEEENCDDVDGRLGINENHRQVPHLHVHNNDRGHSNFVCDRYEIENRCKTSVAVQESVYTNGISYRPSSITQRSDLSHVTPSRFSRSERFHSVEDSYCSSSSGLSSLSGYTVNHSMAPLPQPSMSTHGSVNCMSENISHQNELLIHLAETLQIKLLEVNQKLEKTQKFNEELKSRLVCMQEDNNKHKVINATLYNENVSLQASLQEQSKAKETLDQMCKRLSDEYESLTKPRPRPSVSSNGFYTDDAWTHENFLTLLQGSDADGVNIFESESFANRLKKLLESQWLQRKKPVILDVPNREWVVGEDFILLDDKPLNHIGERQRDGNCSLVFRIRHLKMGQTLILKMMIPKFQTYSDLGSTERYLDANFVPDFLIPLYQFQHPNIISILHHYIGSTGRFKKFVGLLIPRATDVQVNMAKRTTFLVMKEYPMTLKMFFMTLKDAHPEPNYGLNLTFLLHLLYQLLSVVCYLQSQDVIHRNIQSDNIYLDTQLRPVLGDFGLARSLRDVDRTLLPGQEPCAKSARVRTPEISGFNNTGPSVSHPMSLKDMHDREDIFALARMFYCVLRLQADVEDTFPGCSVNLPYCSDNDIRMLPSTIPAGVRHILRQLVQDNPDESITAKRALLSAGMILFAPPKATVKSQEDARHYCQARMLKLLAIRKNSDPDSGHVLTMSESVRVVGPEIEADFISRISFVEFWEIYQYMSNLDLLHVESHNTS